ncbi:MAG: heat-inducible transcriptional repressor HrcA [Raoultibacter sp.]
MLSDRRQKVLAALIEEYVAHVVPVGSRTLTERYHLGVSSATVRNELSILEDDGYIAQPHTSAGRVPTDTGYRAFVDELLQTDLAEDAPVDKEAINELQNNATELDDLMEQTSAALTKLTDCLSIVLPPSTVSLHIKQLSLVSLTPYRVLLVIVTEDGRVLNRPVDFSASIDCDDLAQTQKLLNEVFAGKSLADIKGGMDVETVAALTDPLAQILLGELFACLQENETGRAHSLGMSSLLKMPEFSQAQAFLPVLQMLEDDTVLLQVFDDAHFNEQTMVKIGHENAAAELSGVSVVASQFGQGAGAGVVAVIGPTRMNYSQVIQAVRAAKCALRDL